MSNVATSRCPQFFHYPVVIEFTASRICQFGSDSFATPASQPSDTRKGVDRHNGWPAVMTMGSSLLVFRRLLDPFDRQDFYGPLLRTDLQAELLLKSGEERGSWPVRRRRAESLWHSDRLKVRDLMFVRRPFEFQIV